NVRATVELLSEPRRPETEEVDGLDVEHDADVLPIAGDSLTSVFLAGDAGNSEGVEVNRSLVVTGFLEELLRLLGVVRVRVKLRPALCLAADGRARQDAEPAIDDFVDLFLIDGECQRLTDLLVAVRI